MNSLRDRYRDLLTEMKSIGWHPDRPRLDEISAELDELDYRIRVEVPGGQEYYQLHLMSRAAHNLLGDALARDQIERNVTHAALEREAYDAAHPTILSPQRNAFTREPINAFDRSDERWDGFDR